MTSKKQLIVLIEPDEAVREAISSLIRQHGWQIEAYAQAGDLEALLRAKMPLTLICEASLPDIRSKSALEISENLDIPVIFLGHEREIQDAVDLIHLGAKDFLEKPFPQERLLRLLESLTDEHRS